MILTRRFRKQFMRPKAEKEAMVELEAAIEELKNAFGDRGVSREDLKEIKDNTRQCNFGIATQLCMKRIRYSFKEDLELVSLLQSCCNALLAYHDLKYDRATVDYQRVLAKGRLMPDWYRDYKQQRVEHCRHVTKICIKWADVADQVRFQLILRQDRLHQDTMKKPAFTPTKLASIKEESEYSASNVLKEETCQDSRVDPTTEMGVYKEQPTSPIALEESQSGQLDSTGQNDKEERDKAGRRQQNDEGDRQQVLTPSPLLHSDGEDRGSQQFEC